MKDKTQAQLIDELTQLRQRVAELETAESERAQSEEDLRRSLEESAHNQQLLLALSRAAQAVQRARTLQAVYRAIGDQVADLGFDITVLTLSHDRTKLTLSYIRLASKFLELAEKMTGLSADGYGIAIEPGGFFAKVIEGGETVFAHSEVTHLAEMLPYPARPLARRLMDIAGWRQAIYAPLIINGETQGLLIITGTALAKSDVPAVTVFANQAAIAIENARLLKRDAKSDCLQ